MPAVAAMVLRCLLVPPASTLPPLLTRTITMPQNVAIAKKLHPLPISKFNASQRTLKGFLTRSCNRWLALEKWDDFYQKEHVVFAKKEQKKGDYFTKEIRQEEYPLACSRRFFVTQFFYTSFWPLPCFGGVLKLACMTLVGAISWFWGSEFLSGWFWKRAIEMDHGFFCLRSTGGGEECNPIVFFSREWYWLK